MTETITDKMRLSTALIFRENLNTMIEFGIITETQMQILDRILCDFKCDKNKLQYQTLDIFFRYNSELFDKEFLDKVGNPKTYNVENDSN